MAGWRLLLPSFNMVGVNDEDVFATDPENSDFDTRRRVNPEQPSLFPPQDLIVPDSLRAMKKGVSAIHALPTKEGYSQSLNNRRLFDACIVVAQIHCRQRDKTFLKRVLEERISPVFEVRISDLARIAKIPGKNYLRLYRELDTLYDVGMSWNITSEDKSVEWEMKAHFLSMIGYGQNKNRGVVRFAFDPEVLALVLEPKCWATMSLQVMGKLVTGPSYALYQNAFRYVGTHNKVTSPLPTETWIELLMGASRYVVLDKKGNKRVENFGDFKRRVLVPAIQRVNDVSALDYTLELKELRSGNRIAWLQFKFIPKKQESLGIPLTWHPDVLRSLESIGYSQREIEDLSQAYSSEEVADAIVRLKGAESSMRAKGRVITSKKAYFEGILRNIAQGAASADIDHEAIEAAARQQEAERAAEVRQQRLKEAFQEHQKERFVEWLFSIPDADRQAYLDLFKASSDFTPPVRVVMDKGLTPQNVSAVALLRVWLAKTYPALMDNVLCNPEDKSFDAWMAWRLERSGA